MTPEPITVSHKRTGTIRWNATAADLRTWLDGVPDNARLTIKQARSYSNPADPGGEVTIEAAWEGPR